jgi:Flp pilus assembly protein TadD
MRAFIVIAVLFALAADVGAAPAKPPVHAQASSAIDKLFGQLAKAGSPEEAKPIEEKILAAFERSGSPTVDLLMTRAAASLQGGDADTAKRLLTAITDIAPDFAEGWHQRGILQAASGDDEGAMFCLEKAVSLNPRQFAALAELASKLEEYDDRPGALRLYRKVMALDPNFDDIARKVRGLSHEVEGESL